MSDPRRAAKADAGAGSMSGSLVTNTVLFALSQGLPVEVIEGATGMTLGELSMPEARFSGDIVARLWVSLLRVRSGESLTLRMAKAAPYSFFGPFAYGARESVTLLQALEMFVRFRRILSTSLDASFIRREHDTVLVVSHPSDAIDDGAGAQVGIGVGYRLLSEIWGMAHALVAVSFSHAPIGPEHAYKAFFGVPVHFGGHWNGLHLDNRFLDKAPDNHDPELFGYIELILQRAAERVVVPDGMADVRAAVARQTQRHDYAAASLAKTLGVSLRVLQRRLASKGTSARVLLEEARCAQARELLSDRRLSVDGVAFILGYSDERAFRRAFKRVTGKSPAQFRRSQ